MRVAEYRYAFLSDVRTAYLAHSATSEATRIITMIFVIDYLGLAEACIFKVKIYIFMFMLDNAYL